jgi:hypothetical protein
MKRLLNIFIFLACAICLNGCKCSKNDFTYFKDKIDNIDNYRYYIVNQEIYNNELLLYKKEKNVYLNDNKYRIVINTKEINGIDNEELYSQSQEEYYQQGNDFYYKEGNEWKVRENQSGGSIGFKIKESFFKKYKIKEENGNNLFSGELKSGVLTEFFGFEIKDVSNVILNIEISDTDKVKNVSLEYLENNGNRVVVAIKVGYTQVIDFKLPIVER